jgi:hypothetical protein
MPDFGVRMAILGFIPAKIFEDNLSSKEISRSFIGYLY